MSASSAHRRPMPVRCRAAGLLAGLVLLAAGHPSAGGVGSAAESKVKSAYVYGFGRYVEWPARPGPAADRFAIAVVGDPAMGETLRKVAASRSLPNARGEKVPIEVLTVPVPATGVQLTPGLLPPCQILFLSESLPADVQRSLLASASGRPILVIGEGPDFFRNAAAAGISSAGGPVGGSVGFVRVDGRIKFTVNLADINRRRLKINAKLLTAAHEVVER